MHFLVRRGQPGAICFAYNLFQLYRTWPWLKYDAVAVAVTVAVVVVVVAHMLVATWWSEAKNQDIRQVGPLSVVLSPTPKAPPNQDHSSDRPNTHI